VSGSACIATCRRPAELARCLDALARQTEPPDEIIVSDAGGDADTQQVIDAFRRRQEALVVHCPTPRTALPWQRWWAFQQCRGTFALFLDDDIRLAPDAFALVRQAYRQSTDIAGVGFTITYEGSTGTNATTLRTRWLGISDARPGSITEGGITVDLPNTTDTDTIEVDWLSGGAMSFRRDVLDSMGPLAGLFELYDARIGKAEDAILSSRARRYGRLLLIAGPHAVHPALDQATRTANPQEGYRKGLLETWGRAHVLRWLADDPVQASRAWRRVASLEVARACKTALRHPARSPHWRRLAGDVVGIERTIRHWDRIAEQPDRPSHVTPLMFFWDYDTQWGADRSRLPGPRDWGHLEFPNTDELLDLHAQFAIPACFAVVGAAALPGERPYHDPAQIRRIHAAGHEIASHGFAHEWLPALDRPALLRTLRDSKDALEQCIGAPVTAFVPPFNQPFDFAPAGSFSLSERREAGARRTTLRRLCDALGETGYRFCRVAYAPIHERVGRWLGRRQPFPPAPPVTIGGITCVRIGACGFDLEPLQAICRAPTGAPIVLYGHPHSLHAADANQSVTALRRLLGMTAAFVQGGAMRCLLPAQLTTQAIGDITTHEHADHGARASLL
jgi:GT2 family glycosyltransferase